MSPSSRRVLNLASVGLTGHNAVPESVIRAVKVCLLVPVRLGWLGFRLHFRFFTHVPAFPRGPEPFCGPRAVPPCPRPRPVPLPPPAPLLAPLAFAMICLLVCCVYAKKRFRVGQLGVVWRCFHLLPFLPCWKTQPGKCVMMPIYSWVS